MYKKNLQVSIISILIFLVIFLFLMGCIDSQDLIEETSEKIAFVQCEDLDCLLLSASDCLPTNAKIEQEFSTGINDITLVTSFDLNKIDENQCEMKMKIIDYRVKFIDEYIEMIGGNFTNLEESEEEAREMFLRLFGNRTSVCVGEINEIKRYISTLVNSPVLEELSTFSMSSFDLECEEFIDDLNDGLNDGLNELPLLEENSSSCIFDEDCYKGICINKKCLTPEKVEDCESMSSSINKQKCIKLLALKNNDISLCATMVSAQTHSTVQSDCFGELAVKNNDLNICNTQKFNAIKSNFRLSDMLAEGCVEKYCEAYGQEGWVWCPED